MLHGELSRIFVGVFFSYRKLFPFVLCEKCAESIRFYFVLPQHKVLVPVGQGGVRSRQIGTGKKEVRNERHKNLFENAVYGNH